MVRRWVEAGKLVLACFAAIAPPAAVSQNDEALQHARTVNLAYAAHMPSFVADEIAKRYASNSKSAKWRYVDTIQTEITFSGPRAVRRQIRRNETPWEQPFEALPGFKWYGGFGTEIRPLFDPQCPTRLEYDGAEQWHGKKLLRYRFSSPADGCFAYFYLEDQRANPPRSGNVLIEDPGGSVIRLDEEATGFPENFGFVERDEEVSWDYVKIGDTGHLLPVAAHFKVSYVNGARTRIDVEYRNHRHFEASSNIQFPKDEIRP